MRSLLLIAAVLVTGALTLEPGQVCEPGSNFMVECNKCRCSSDGKLMSCTRKFCIPESFQGDDPKTQPAVAEAAQDTGLVAEKKEEELVHTNGQVCKPNESKLEDCNRCKCAANGIGWFCTRNACPPREKRHALRASPPQCTPGTSFKSADGCNDCFCTETGIAACTMKFCFNDKVKREISKPTKQCEPGTSFKSADGCNDCFCTETGIAACTLRACFPDPPKVKREAQGRQHCAKGARWFDGCNTCFCGENGIVSCTRKFCAPIAKRDVQQQCVPGTTFKDAEGCNDCFCTSEGRAACTEKLCYKPLKVKRDAPKKECEPGTSFKSADGCNDCFCTETGIAACTQKFCFPAKPKRQVSIGSQIPKTDCKPGTSFKAADGCNECFCSENGIAACTLRFCLPDPPKEKRSVDDLPQSKLAPGTEGFECAANKAFKYQCNTCRCDNTGKFAACTYKLCVEGDY